MRASGFHMRAIDCPPCACQQPARHAYMRRDTRAWKKASASQLCQSGRHAKEAKCNFCAHYCASRRNTHASYNIAHRPACSQHIFASHKPDFRHRGILKGGVGGGVDTCRGVVRRRNRDVEKGLRTLHKA